MQNNTPSSNRQDQTRNIHITNLITKLMGKDFNLRDIHY